MKYKNVLLEIKDNVATITLNRPEKLNAINDAMLREFEAALGEVRDDEDSWVVIIKGAGRSFSTGQDLSGVGTDRVMPPNPRRKAHLDGMFTTALQNSLMWQSIFELPKRTIAQVHGYCLGAGLDLAMSCQTIIATDDAIFGDPSVRMGLASSNPLWTFRVGLKKAKELLLTGEYVDGREAEKIGLIMKAAPSDQIEDEVALAADTFIKSTNIGGRDGVVDVWATNMTILDIGGLSAARKFAAHIHTLSAIQRPERSIIDCGEFNFYDTREKKGLRAAIEERDAPFREFFPLPQRTKGR